MTAATRKKDRGRRAEIEKELRDTFHVSFEYLPGVPTSDFDIDRSLKNQARFEPINEETVATYQEAVERGDDFPAILAYRPGRGRAPKLVSIDGNHRLIAHDRAGSPIDVYEIDRATKPQAIQLIMMAFNAKHGLKTTEQERLSQALYLMDNGVPMKDAAAQVNVRLADLKRAANRAQGDKRAAEAGVDLREWETLGPTVRARLLNVSTDEGFAGAAHLAFLARLGAEEVFELVGLLNATRSAARQRAIVKSETERYQDKIQDTMGGRVNTKGKRPMTAKGRVQMILGQVLALPEDIQSIARSFGDAERGDKARELIGTSERLRKLALALDPDVK